MLALATSMVFLITGMDEPLMADEQIAPCERLLTYFADEGLLLGVGADVSLEVFLRRLLASEASRVELAQFVGRSRTRRANRRWQCGQGKVFVFEPEGFLLTFPVLVVVVSIEWDGF